MGFRTTERMTGHHEFRNGLGSPGRHPFAFRVTWGPERLRDWLDPRSDRFLWQELSGEVEAGGLCGPTPCEGTLHLQYGQGRIRYVFDFDVRGTTHRFVGDKVWLRWHNLAVTHRLCTGTVVELGSGRLVSTAVTTFKWRDLPGLLLGGVRPRHLRAAG